MVDFSQLLNNKDVMKKIDPVDIYDSLDRKVDTGPLRSSQVFILKEWFNKRQDHKDVIIKLHTGEGKTLIGLLILQSKINAGKGPCLLRVLMNILHNKFSVMLKSLGYHIVLLAGVKQNFRLIL